MTQPLQITDPSYVPAAPHAWLTVDRAASLANETPRNMRRRAAEEWLPQGRARLNNWTPGKRAFWEIRDDADPLFAVVPVPVPQVISEGAELAPPLLEKAAHRKAILARWEQAVAHARALNMTKIQATEHFIAALKREGIQGVSARTLHYWKNDSRRGLAGLVDGRSRRYEARNEDPFLTEVRQLYEHENGRSLKWCYDHAELKARQCGWTICGLRAANRYIDSLNKAELILRREGPKAFNDKCIPDITRDYSTLRSNEVWVADHHQLDVLVQVDKRLDYKTGEERPIYARPWLTVWMDCRSRKVVGWIIRAEDPNTWAIINALDIAIEAHGLPEVAYTDNGKDFDSKAFTGLTKKQARLFKAKKLHVDHDQLKLGGIYAALSIDHMHAWKYHGQSKPVERFFGTVAGRFSVHFDTYCGRSAQDRPEGLEDRIDRGLAPTLESLVADFGQWLQGDYQHKAHGGDSMEEYKGGPAQAWEVNRGTIRTIAPRLREVLLQPRVGPLKVTKNGVAHLGIGYGKGQLRAHFGREVYLRLRPGVQTASIWSLDDKELLAIVDANESVPFLSSPEQADLAVKEKRRDTRILKESFKARLRMHETTAQRLHRMVQAQDDQAVSPDTNPDPYILKPHRSDLESHLNALQEDRRMAAGAESMSLDDLSDAFSRGDQG